MSRVLSFEQALSEAQASASELDLNALQAAGVYLDPLDYYVFGSVYPPLKAMGPIGTDELFRHTSRDLNVYVHVPFCDQYCTFCHFAKEIRPDSDRVNRYLGALSAEIRSAAERLPSDATIRTLYFGGGTASYLDANQIGRLFADLGGCLRFAEDVEISYELHPNLTQRPDAAERLSAMRASGVNRWVFGAQSMEDRVLKKLNRGHTAADVLELLAMLEPFAEQNVSVDLIFGLPYQTLPGWYETLTTLVEAATPKFNIFPLMLKIGDPITRQFLREPVIFPTPQERFVMHYMAWHILGSAGYRYGPVFYYSRPVGPASRQQVSKFESIDDANLLGFGVSAFGYLGGTHYYNECTTDAYIAACEAHQLPTWVGISLSDEERLRRTVIETLRADGVSKKKLLTAFGVDPFELFAPQFAKLEELGLVDVADGVARLTRHGAAHADGIDTLFVSDEVADLIRRRNEEIRLEGQPTRNLFERFDYTPLQRRNGDYAEGLTIGKRNVTSASRP